MAVVKQHKREILFKLVFCGPPGSGKTTNLRVVHDRVAESHRSNLISMATSADSTLFFDFLHVDGAELGGYQTRFQLYTVPGQVAYSATRQLVLRGADGLVFVADSDPLRLEENAQTFNGLREDLRLNGTNPQELPLVMQYNKRDLPNAVPQGHLDYLFNSLGAPLPAYQACALDSLNVLEALDGLAQQVMAKFSAAANAGASSSPGSGRANNPGENPSS